MSGSVRKNYIYFSFTRIYSLFLSLISSPYISRKLGPEGVGINSYTFAIVSYVILFGTLKSDFFSAREFIYRGKTKEMFWNIYFLRFLTMFIATLIYIFYAVKSTMRIYFLLALPSVISGMIDVGWFYIATENFKALAL
jgi:O-antigen/teichoic acid export membrane protein